MTSQLNVDTIVDKAGSSGPSLPNTTTIKMGNTSTYVSDGGAVTQNTVQGLTKAWNNFNGSGTVAYRDSFNYSSITDDATGKYTCTMTNNMSNSHPTTTFGSFLDAASHSFPRFTTGASYESNTAKFTGASTTYNDGTDHANISLATTGDLA
tara:strand:+ start:86 stop:541 length:456 start_codon:yes stop_codon:yes gene_type:complete